MNKNKWICLFDSALYLLIYFFSNKNENKILDGAFPSIYIGKTSIFAKVYF